MSQRRPLHRCLLCLSEVWCVGRNLRFVRPPHHTSCEVWWGLVAKKTRNFCGKNGKSSFPILTFESISRGPSSLFGPFGGSPPHFPVHRSRRVPSLFRRKGPWHLGQMSEEGRRSDVWPARRKHGDNHLCRG